ncbi:hypothetical protein K469DRAFT_701611, partial [Zopfia rhizophila CBS 207.26]
MPTPSSSSLILLTFLISLIVKRLSHEELSMTQFSLVPPSSSALSEPAQPLQTFLAGSSGAGNRDLGYAAFDMACSNGTTCEAACGGGYNPCWAVSNNFGNWTGCFDNSLGERCCIPTGRHAKGATCQRGYYCVEVTSEFTNGLFC